MATEQIKQYPYNYDGEDDDEILRNELEKQYNDLTMEYPTSAREYFMILRLAIFHTDGVFLETSVEITKYEKSQEVYERAIAILKALASV